MSDLDQLREIGAHVRPPSFEALESTARRRSRRTAAALALACAALVLMAGGGLNLAGDNERSAPAPAGPSPSKPEPTYLPSGAEPTYSPRSGEVMELPRNQQWATLGQGRYSVRVSPSLAYEVSVPNETRAFEGRFLNTPPPGGLVGSIVWVAPAPAGDTRLPRHPCRDHTPTPVGPTVADLATALTQQPALDVSDPEPVTVDGNDGLSINVSNPDNLDISTCEDDTVALFSTGSDDWGWDEDFQGRWHILDVDGERVVIKDQCSYCAKSHSRAAQQMIESITFHPSE